MYINSLKIDKYQILEDLEIEFQIPKDNKSVVNVIAGVNGCGKTTLLEWIVSKYYGQVDGSGGLNYHNDGYNNNPLLTVQYKISDCLSPRIIYIPSNMTFSYSPKNNLDINLEFIHTVNTKDIVGNAELYIKNFIIDEERKSTISDPQVRTKGAVDKFNSIFKDSDLITKLIDLDGRNQNRPIFETINGDTVTIDQLSSGEQQLYARVVSLMILNPHNSVILIDEPEIALHPTWQIDIMNIYKNIGVNNQFIVTTHSPFIISQTPYKNLIFLVKENEKIMVKQFSQPPLDRDLNTIVKTIMGADYLPKELDALHKEYRKLFEDDKLDTYEAKKLELKILEFESPNSSFFQGINFDKALKL